MKRFIVVLLAVAALSVTAVAQKKSWTEWDKKEVDKMLNGSPWGQTQTDTDTSQMVFQPTSRDSAMTADGARNQAVELKYRIRLFSALPVREAFARLVLLSNPAIKPEQLNNFLNGDYSESIIVAVAYESPDRRYLGPVSQKFDTATTESLRNSAYLERSDGKRVPLEEYARASSDGTGAKFVFPRMVDGKEFLGPNDSMHFVADFGGGIKVSWRFKASDMQYKGKIEY